MSVVWNGVDMLDATHKLVIVLNVMILAFAWATHVFLLFLIAPACCRHLESRAWCSDNGEPELRRGNEGEKWVGLPFFFSSSIFRIRSTILMIRTGYIAPTLFIAVHGNYTINFDWTNLIFAIDSYIYTLVCLMHIELLFPVVLCLCRCLWQDLISDACSSSFSLTSLKPNAF